MAPQTDPSALTLDKVHRHLHRTVQDHSAAEFCPECHTARLLLGAFVVMTATVLWAVWEWVQHDTLMNLVSRL